MYFVSRVSLRMCVLVLLLSVGSIAAQPRYVVGSVVHVDLQLEGDKFTPSHVDLYWQLTGEPRTDQNTLKTSFKCSSEPSWAAKGTVTVPCTIPVGVASGWYRLNTADLYNRQNQYRRSDIYGDCSDPNQGCVVIRIVSEAKGSIPARVKRAKLK
jgi:hypothetical protein